MVKPRVQKYNQIKDFTIAELRGISRQFWRRFFLSINANKNQTFYDRKNEKWMQNFDYENSCTQNTIE